MFHAYFRNGIRYIYGMALIPDIPKRILLDDRLLFECESTVRTLSHTVPIIAAPFQTALTFLEKRLLGGRVYPIGEYVPPLPIVCFPEANIQHYDGFFLYVTHLILEKNPPIHSKINADLYERRLQCFSHSMRSLSERSRGI